LSNPGTLRFGIILNEEKVQQWQSRAVELLLSDSRIIPVFIILPEHQQESPTRSLLNKLDRTVLYRWYRRKFGSIPAQQLTTMDWPVELDVIHCATETKKGAQYFLNEDLDKIRAYKPDFILRFGLNILRGGILSAAKYGIWSFHHGDEQYFRGGPPAFWEIYQGKKVCGSILQRLTEKLDAGIILKKGWFPVTLHSLRETHQRLLSETASWPLQVAKDMLNGQLDPDSLQPVTNMGPVYSFPDNLTMLLWLIKSLKYKLQFHFDDLFRAEQWNIGIADQPIDKIANQGLQQVHWLPSAGRNRFKADSFGVYFREHRFILFEDYDYRKAIGRILACDENGNTFDCFPESAHHLSYPFVFVYDNDLYCIPESFEKNQVDLYIWQNDRKTFNFFKTILSGTQLTDPTLVQIGELWWLFCTERARSNFALSLFYSNSPFGPFKAHANNPVKWDITSSRPAGNIFCHEGKWYRPAQDCGETYGSRIVIHEIESISPEVYRERKTNVIEPFAPYPDGVHTIAQWGDKTLVDGKRFRFSSARFSGKLKEKLKKIG
jgi:hypothetical protein